MIAGYILDFYCRKAVSVIEVDGNVQGLKTQGVEWHLMRTKPTVFPIPIRLQWLLAAVAAGLITRATHPRTLLLTGLIFGLAQWVILYSRLRSRGWLAHALWLPATGISGLVGYLLIATVGVRVLGPVLIAFTAPYENFASHLIFLTLLWTVIGLGQWPLLRHWLPRARRWIPISAGGGATGALIDVALQWAGMEIYTSILAGMLAGGGYGIVTGPLIAQLKGDN